MNLTTNFSYREFASKCGRATPPQVLPNIEELAKNLQVLRDEIGKPIRVLSGYRSPEHNQRIGGSTNSYHMKGMAADIVVPGMAPAEIMSVIERLVSEGKMKQGGMKAYVGFLHYDIRGFSARW